MLSIDLVVDKMRQEGYRITKPRQAVIRAILEDGSYSSPAEVHQRAKLHYPTVGLVTVYRTLDLLTEMGFARRIHSEERCQGYVAASHGHRHHLVCRRCGATVEIDGCDLSPFLARVSRETGYRIQDHLLELTGICSTCQ